MLKAQLTHESTHDVYSEHQEGKQKPTPLLDKNRTNLQNHLKM